jgi:cytochrome c biogenesis protein CcmG, thiol:disulfide interchange protein DsbE
MKYLTYLITFLLLSGGAFSQGNTITKARQLPSVDIKDVKGNPFNTSKIVNDGKPIILSFWATWCKPCIKEMTTINDVYSEWQEETGVKIYAISIDDARSSAQVAPMANGKGWEYIVLLDPNGDFKRAMNVGPIPHTFVVNGKGEIVWQHTSFSEGAELDLIEIVRKVQKGEEIK